MDIIQNQIETVINFFHILCDNSNNKLTNEEIESLKLLLKDFYNQENSTYNMSEFLNLLKKENNNNQFNKLIEIMGIYKKRLF